MTFAVSDCHDCFHVNLIVVRRFVFVFSVFFYSLFIFFFVVLFSVFLVLLFSVCPHRVVCIFLISNGEHLHLLFMPLFFFSANLTPPPPPLPLPLTCHVQAKDSTLNSIIHGACSEICMFYMPFRLSFCLLLSDVVAAAIAVVVVIVCCGLFKDSMLAAL